MAKFIAVYSEKVEDADADADAAKAQELMQRFNVFLEFTLLYYFIVEKRILFFMLLFF